MRAKLEEEVPDGMYDLSINGEFTMLTGKGGYIEYRVAMQRELNKRVIDSPEEFDKTQYKHLDASKLEQIINDIMAGRK